MRVRMLKSMTVTVDGVHRVDLDDGVEYDVGDGVGADLVEANAATDVTGPEPVASSGGTRRHAETLAPEAAAVAVDAAAVVSDASWPSFHAEIDDVAAQHGVVFPDPSDGKKLTVADKVVALEAAGHLPGDVVAVTDGTV